MPIGEGDIDLVVIAAASDSDRRRQAHDLALQLGVECMESVETDHEYRLIVSDERVELCGRSMKPGHGVWVDFAAIDRRTISRKQPLAKAMGKGTSTVIDATAGLGQDAFLLVCLGYDVTAIERSPVIAALLEDGFRRALEHETLCQVVGECLRIVNGDAISILTAMAGAPCKPDVVYLDPMYPPKRKESALPRKEMQMLRAVVGDDPDAHALCTVAMRAAAKRVVAKRPLHAPPLAPEPATSITGKLARFDVYPVHR